jgi:amidase
MRRLFTGCAWIALALWVDAGACDLRSAAGPLDLSRATATEIAAALTARTVTSELLVRRYLERIRRCDGQYHAIIATNPAALALAKSLDAERAAGKVRGPLHGIPVIIKDNIDVAGMVTTAGSLALKENLRVASAPVVQRLQDAGAIVLAKSNLSEWANFRSRQSISGWSAVGGLTVNAHDVTRSACGSSSGSAVAVALRYAPLALGTETNGSIVCPASVNGVVGFKPTLGGLPGEGIVPISHRQDTAGPIAATVADAALLLAGMQARPDYPPPAGTLDLRGVRLGVARFLKGFSPKTESVFAGALEKLRERGAVLVEIDTLDLTELRDLQLPLLLAEFAPALDDYLRETPPAVRVRTLAQLIAFNRQEPAEFRLFTQDLFEQSQATNGLADPAYLQSLARARAAAEAALGRFRELRLDALVAPTSGPAWKIDTLNGDRSVGSASLLPAFAGGPHLTVPMGDIESMPVGLSVFGIAGSDGKVISIGHAFAQPPRSDHP